MIKRHLQIKPNGKNYYAVISAPDEFGKRKQKWVNTHVPVKGSNKRKAENKLSEILAEYNEGGTSVFKDADFAEFMVQWLEIAKSNLSPVTYDGYKAAMNAHILPHFAAKSFRVKDITPTVIQGYIHDRLEYGLSANTVRRQLANISKCLDSAVKQNIIAFNPVNRVEKPKVQKFTGAKAYNQSQIDKLFEISKGDPLEIVILLTLFYGFRRSEVLGLKWDAIDLEERTLTVKHTVIRMGKNIHKLDRTKNDSSYATFPIPGNVLEKLLELKKKQEEQRALQPNDYCDEGYVCAKHDGRVFRPCYISQHFALLLKKNGMPHIRFHDLRHSSASYLKHLGFDLKDIQTWLRHKDIQTTMNIYTHLDMEAKNNIADVLSEKFQMLGIGG